MDQFRLETSAAGEHERPAVLVTCVVDNLADQPDNLVQAAQVESTRESLAVENSVSDLHQSPFSTKLLFCDSCSLL